MADRDIRNLPVWGQVLVRRLEGERDRARRDLEDYKARETATLEDSTVVADPYGECPRPLGKDPSVHFNGRDISFCIEFDSAEGILTVTATGSGPAAGSGLAVYPWTSNGIRLKGGRP